MAKSRARVTRRQMLRAGAGSLFIPFTLKSGKAPAQGGKKPFEGVTLNISCWSSTYPTLLAQLHPRVHREDRHQGQLRHARLPGLQPARRPRAVDQGQRLRRAERHLHLHQPLDRRRLADAARRVHQGPRTHAGRLGLRRFPARRRRSRCATRPARSTASRGSPT